MVISKSKQTIFTGSNVTLLKVAGIGGFVVCSAGYLFKSLIERKFTKTEFYQKAVEHVLAHKALVNYLGEPIKFGSVNISKTGRNYATETTAACEVPIRGSKEKGKIYFTALRREINEETSTTLKPSSQNDDQSLKYEDECIYCKTVKLSPWEIERIEVSIDSRPNEKVVVPVRPFVK